LSDKICCSEEGEIKPKQNNSLHDCAPVITGCDDIAIQILNGGGGGGVSGGDFFSFFIILHSDYSIMILHAGD